MDCYDGDILYIKDAFKLMREIKFVDENGEIIYYE